MVEAAGGSRGVLEVGAVQLEAAEVVVAGGPCSRPGLGGRHSAVGSGRGCVAHRGCPHESAVESQAHGRARNPRRSGGAEKGGAPR